MVTASDMVDRMLDPVGRAIAGDAARRIANLPPDPELQACMADLAARANDGRLTEEERSEYEFALTASTVVSLLRAKARDTLASASSAA